MTVKMFPVEGRLAALITAFEVPEQGRNTTKILKMGLNNVGRQNLTQGAA